MLSRVSAVLALMMVAAWFFFAEVNTVSIEETATPTVCPPIEYGVEVDVPRTVTVGETFVLHSTSTGYAGLAQTRLYIEYRLASVPDLVVGEPLPVVEVLPDSSGSSLGTGEFVLRALKPGTIWLYTEVYGDAYFYSTECNRGTTFKLLRSDSVSVSIVPGS